MPSRGKLPVAALGDGHDSAGRHCAQSTAVSRSEDESEEASVGWGSEAESEASDGWESESESEASEGWESEA